MKERLGSAIALLCAILCIVLAVSVTWGVATRGGSLTVPLVLVVAALGLGLGLIRGSRWALRSLAALFLVAAIILPGVFSPFVVGDYLAAGRQPPTVGATLIWFVPVELLLLTMAFFVDPSSEQRAS